MPLGVAPPLYTVVAGPVTGYSVTPAGGLHVDIAGGIGRQAGRGYAGHRRLHAEVGDLVDLGCALVVDVEVAGVVQGKQRGVGKAAGDGDIGWVLDAWVIL
jgi:hypothetical protein